MPLVTITRSLGCEETDIAKSVAEQLNVRLYDDSALKKTALEMGIRSEDLKSLDEKAPGYFDRILSRMPQLYLDFMEAVVYEVAHQGQGVIIGHGSQVLLRDFGCALHVFIQAPESTRIDNLVSRHGLSRVAAVKLIQKNDNEHRGFFRYAYHMRMNDPSLYDLVINTEKMGSEATIKLIVEAARSEEIETCSLEAVDRMERLSQTKKVRAALIESDINVSMLHIDVSEKDVVEIQGFAYTNDEKDRIVAAANSIKGVSQVKTEIKVMPSAGD